MMSTPPDGFLSPTTTLMLEVPMSSPAMIDEGVGMGILRKTNQSGVRLNRV
jgi:hypothetical protein